MPAATRSPSPERASSLGQVRVLANREGLADCLALTERVCARLALSSADTQAVRLAVEEACANVVDHAYQGTASGPLALSLRLAAPDLLEAQVSDQARPFPPEAAPRPDLSADLDARPIGGLGWHLIREFMTDVRYHSDAHGNHLVLTRRLCAPASGETA